MVEKNEPKGQKYDVSVKIGLLYILGCGAVGAVIGALLPFIADQIGLLYLGRTSHGLQHAGLKELAFFSLGGILIGMVNGVILSVNRNFWWRPLLMGTIPCGFFGGITAWTAPKGLSQAGNVIAFVLIPLAVSGISIVLRDRVWGQHQKLVVGETPKPAPIPDSKPKTKAKKKK